MPRSPAPIDIVHLALAMGGFAIGTAEYASMSLLPFFSAALHIDEPTAGHAISAYAPLLAVAASRFSRRHVLSALAPGYRWMLVFRFLSGLPHGAYFGMASLVAAALVPTAKRTQAVARVMLGLTVATIIGVPAANWLGQTMGVALGLRDRRADRRYDGGGDRAGRPA